jgi:EAL domain-containing protein (putative c-di-GMP-specific phosphodiesterase class I)
MAISVCVEGLENEEDLHCLLEIGIKKFQGFLFGKPTINSYSEINFN